MNRSTVSRLFAVLLSLQVSSAWAIDIDWISAISLKNNYVVSTGLVLDDGPGLQYWTRGYFKNGAYLDYFANLPLSKGNPNRAAEIDYTAGYVRQFSDWKLDVQLAYYDIQFPSLFDNDGDALVPKIKLSSGPYFVEALRFFWDRTGDGVRIGGGAIHSLDNNWSLLSQLNYVDGPFANEQVIIGKLRITRKLSLPFIDKISFEMFDLLYQEDPDDRRGFTWTVGLSKSFD